MHAKVPPFSQDVCVEARLTLRRMLVVESCNRLRLLRQGPKHYRRKKQIVRI